LNIYHIAILLKALNVEFHDFVENNNNNNRPGAEIGLYWWLCMHAACCNVPCTQCTHIQSLDACTVRLYRVGQKTAHGVHCEK